MTAGQARGALVGFALVLLGAIVNALYLQDRGQAPREGARTSIAAAPAPREPPSSAAILATPLRIARFAPASPPMPAAPGVARPDHETVRAIQRELAARGFGPLPSDGNLGLATRAAILAYEQDQRLVLTATPSEALLRRLVLGNPAGTPGGEPSDWHVASPEAAAVLAEVQRSLAELGYQPGPADGRLGEETLRAIHDFEVDRGMVPRRRISAELVRQLEAAQRAAGR
jgi:peptidoglycan hydrolase-like protein with peptidoglycan-binding domain